MTARILVVDDNETARLVLKDMLRLQGHQVVGEADDMAGALDAYAQHKPDLVTLDLALGKEDGLQVLAALRKKDSKAKVLIVSSNSQQKTLDRVRAAGAVGFLPKPFGMEDLQEAIADAVGS